MPRFSELKSQTMNVLGLAALVGFLTSVCMLASAQTVGYDRSYYRSITRQPQQGPPCGHYGTAACPPPPLGELGDEDQGLSGQELWVQGSRLLQQHNASGAVPYFARSAELGDPRGQAAFGQALLLGRGVQADVPTGLAWVRRSAASGDRGGEFVLGELYGNGRYVEHDASRAAQFYLASARQSFSPAERKLGVAYELGEGVPRSRVTAISWLQRAARDGGGDAWPRQIAGFLNRPKTPRFANEPVLFTAFNQFVADSYATAQRTARRSGGSSGPACYTGGGTYVAGGGCGSAGRLATESAPAPPPPASPEQ